MGRQVYRINQDGKYIEPVLLTEDAELPEDCVEQSPEDGMYDAHYDRKKKKWIDKGTRVLPKLKLPNKMRDGIETNLLLEELLQRVEKLEGEKRQ